MTTRIPSLNWLRVFEAAARTESFARAAGQLNMSAAAVSQQVKALETQLGTPLFKRHAHAVSLTEAGRAYLPSVQQSLLLLETATTGLFGASRENRLFVQSVLLFAHGVLGQGVPEFQAAHPEINLALSTGNLAADFANQFADLQIVFGNPYTFGAEGDVLLSETLYPVARADIAEQIRTPEDLQKFTLIEVSSHRAGWPALFDHMRLSHGNARYFFTDTTVMAAQLAANGVGIALARTPSSDVAVRSCNLHRCLPEVSVAGHQSYHLIYPDRAALRPPARKFRSWLLDYMASDARWT
jgi:DNA-binding transcriptional LysR family regulator